MFRWLRRLLGRPDEEELLRFIERIKALNESASGGPPVRCRELLGTLDVPSRTLALADPQYIGGPQLIPGIPTDQVEIWGALLKYPNGSSAIAGLEIRCGDEIRTPSIRKVGEACIDSAKVVIGDRQDIAQHWTKTGPDRIGVISTAPDRRIHDLICKTFGIQTQHVNSVTAHVVGPIAASLESEITAFLKSIERKYEFASSCFRVRTNNSFERVNYFDKSWGFMPVGNASTPEMFISRTGYGDGTYDINVVYNAETPQLITVWFVSDDEAQLWLGQESNEVV